MPHLAAHGFWVIAASQKSFRTPEVLAHKVKKRALTLEGQ
jgi:hypothetical protein